MFFGGRRFAFQVLLVILGICWCASIWRRRHEDIRVIRESKDVVERGVVIGFWLSALFVALLLGTFGVSTVVEFVSMLWDIVR